MGDSQSCVAFANEYISDAKWNVKPARIFYGTFETSLNQLGFSISLCNLSKAAAASGSSSVTELLDLLDLQTSAVSWPNQYTPMAKKASAMAAAPISIDNNGAKEKLLAEGDILGE